MNSSARPRTSWPTFRPTTPRSENSSTETGFEANEWAYLGSSLPNTAFLDNRIHHWLAKDAVRVADPANSEHEYTQVETYPEAELAGLVHRGEIEHSLGLVALSRVFDLRLPPPER